MADGTIHDRHHNLASYSSIHRARAADSRQWVRSIRALRQDDRLQSS